MLLRTRINGFTLFELMVSITVLLVVFSLAMLVLLRYSNYFYKSSKRLEQAEQITYLKKTIDHWSFISTKIIDFESGLAFIKQNNIENTSDSLYLTIDANDTCLVFNKFDTLDLKTSISILGTTQGSVNRAVLAFPIDRDTIKISILKPYPLMQNTEYRPISTEYKQE